MTTPNIDMITASLWSCSLGRGRRGSTRPPPHLVEASGARAGVTVELNSEAALPYHWEQYLDMRTGEVYYINWETGVRTTDDPRSSTAAAPYSDEDDISDEDSGDNRDSDDDSGDTAGSSCLSSTSSPETSSEYSNVDGGGQVLVAAGCKTCFTYFMVPEGVEACQQCGGHLLLLGRSRDSLV